MRYAANKHLPGGCICKLNFAALNTVGVRRVQLRTGAMAFNWRDVYYLTKSAPSKAS